MYIRLVALLVCAGFFSSTAVLAKTATYWTLDASIQRVMQVAPEIKMADADIGVQRGKLEQAGAWPNPTVAVRADDKLGIEDGGGGYDITQFAISQPLPLNRLGHQRQQAQAALNGAEAKYRYQRLMLEYKVAQQFHMLQLAQAKLDLAKLRLQQAKLYQSRSRKSGAGDPLVRYLTPLERMRLDIVLQTAKQMLDMAEGEYSETASAFRTLLDLPFDGELKVPALTAVVSPRSFKQLQTALRDHPNLKADKQAIMAAEAGVAVARSRRFDDPVLTLFREKDFLANRRDDITGIMLSIQIPLWNRNSGMVTEARYAVMQAKAEMELKQRQLVNNLHKSYLHLGHLIEQTEHYRTHLLQPAQRVLKLTQQDFATGALNVLNLIDANNTYFDTKQRYYELQMESWLELSELRKSAGLSVLDNSLILNSSEVK